jgi:hypothetical protein
MTLHVQRNRWHRGKEAAEKDAYLYNSETQKFDIVGFILGDMGYANYCDKKRLPSIVAHKVLQRNEMFAPPLHWMVTRSHADTADVLELIRLNDDPHLKEDERESKIHKFLAERGVVVVFEDAVVTKRAGTPKKNTFSASFGSWNDVPTFTETPDEEEFL